MLGKFSTHEYICTNKKYCCNSKKPAAQKLQDAILGFFTHYRSIVAQEKYEVLKSSSFKSEFKEFEKYVNSYWNLEVCGRFCLSVRTNYVESFFATRLYFVPKNVTFAKTYEQRMKICGLQWNENHISDRYKATHGSVAHRKIWQQNVHNRVFTKHVPKVYSEKRGFSDSKRTKILKRKFTEVSGVI